MSPVLVCARRVRVPFGVFRPTFRACGTPCDVFAGPYRACLRSAGLCHAPEFLQISRITKKAARALAKSKASPPKRAPLHARLPSHSLARASIFLGLLLHSQLERPLYGCWVAAPVASLAGTIRVSRSAVSDAGIAIFIKTLRSKHSLLNSH